MNWMKLYKRVERTRLYRYGVAALAALVVVLLTVIFWDIVHERPHILLFPAVVVAAWQGGFLPGVLCATISHLAISYLLIGESQSVFSAPSDALEFGVFVATAMMISWLEEQRNHTENRLTELNEEFQVILNSIGEGITVQQPDGHVIFTNAASAAITGEQVTDEQGIPVQQLRPRFTIFDEEGKPLPYSALPRMQAMATGKPAELTFGMKREDEPENRWVRVISSPVLNFEGGVRLIVNVLQDVTEKRNIERERVANEQRMRKVLDNISAMVGVVRPDGTLLWANRAALEATGLRLDEIVDRPLDQAPPFAYDKSVQAGVQQALTRAASGELVRYDVKVRAGDDTMLTVDFALAPVYDDDGKLEYLIPSAVDITERVKLVERLQLERYRTETILNSVPGIVYEIEYAPSVLPSERRTTFTSQYAETMLGYPVSEWANTPNLWPKVVHPDDWGGVVQQANETYLDPAQDVTGVLRFRCVAADGRIVHVESHNRALRDLHGNILGTCGIVLDITERVQLIEQLKFEQRRMEAIMNSIPGAIFEGALAAGATEQHLAYMSKYAETMFGYPVSDWINIPRFNQRVVHPDDFEESLRIAVQNYEQGKLGPTPFRCITADGRTIHVEAYLNAITDQDGNLVGSCGIMMDVTERRQQEAEIIRLNELVERERQRLAMIISHVPGIVWEGTGSPEHGAQPMTFVSAYAEVMLGYSPAEWLNAPDFWRKIVVPEDWETSKQDATRVYNSGQSGRVQYRVFARDGRIVHLESHSSVVRSPLGQPIGAVGVLFDITDRHRIETAIRRYTEELTQSNEDLERFAYVASHDLQEPLRMVTSYLGLIEQRYADKLDTDGREFIAYAVDGAARMKELIKDLLAYSRIQRSQNEFEMVMLDDVLEQVLRDLALTIEDTNAIITHDPLPEIEAIPLQMRQLFQNLLANAIKFRGERTPEIHIGVQRDTDYWHITVADNGIGIEAEYLERIFVIFQRLHARSEYPGTGIGLAICRKIMDKHKGEIYAESTPGVGTIFHLRFPAHREVRSRLYGAEADPDPVS